MPDRECRRCGAKLALIDARCPNCNADRNKPPDNSCLIACAIVVVVLVLIFGACAMNGFGIIHG